MDLLNGKIQTFYRKYLNAAFGSVLILILPLILNASAIWHAMPNTEVLALAYAETAMKKYTDSLPVEAKNRRRSKRAAAVLLLKSNARIDRQTERNGGFQPVAFVQRDEEGFGRFTLVRCADDLPEYPFAFASICADGYVPPIVSGGETG